MLCRDCKRVVYFFLDGSLGEKKQKDFAEHLSLCPECDGRTRFHQRIRAFLSRRLANLNLAAPDRLKTRISRSVRAFRAEWSR